MKAQITQKNINLPKLFFVNYVRAGTSNSLQYLIWLNSKTVKIYSIVQSVKLLLALSILFCSIMCLYSKIGMDTRNKGCVISLVSSYKKSSFFLLFVFLSSLLASSNHEPILLYRHCLNYNIFGPV